MTIPRDLNCQPLLQRRQACYQKYHGLDQPPDDWFHKRSSKSASPSSSSSSSSSNRKQQCLISTLAAKRCLAFQQQECELEALHYYGTPNDAMGPKALCASFDEGYCFGNPQVMNVDNGASAEREKVFAHHQKAKRKIVNDRNKFRACQEISDRMHQCLLKKFSNSNGNKTSSSSK